MLRILLSISSMIAACTSSPQKAAMPSSSPASATIAQSSSESSPEPVAVVKKNAAPGPLTDSPVEAQGRRILSTAFVRVGPDGHLTVELRNGRVLVLRDLVMRPRDYCGVQAPGDQARARYCGGYAEVAAARPGGGPAPASNPVEAAGGVAERK